MTQSPFIRIVVASVAIVYGARQIRAAAGIQAYSYAGGLITALTIIATIGACLAYVRVVERLTATELCATGAASEFASGLITGGVLFGITMSILWLSGVATFSAGSGWRASAYSLLAALIAAVGEEIVFRGIVFRSSRKALAPGLRCRSRRQFSVRCTPSVPVRRRPAASRSPWMEAYCLRPSKRTHDGCGWRSAFMRPGISPRPVHFGASVPGFSAHGVLTSRLQGAEILTGGLFGPEASIVAVLVCLIASFAFIVRAIRTGHFIAPFWRRLARPSGIRRGTPPA